MAKRTATKRSSARTSRSGRTATRKSAARKTGAGKSRNTRKTAARKKTAKRATSTPKDSRSKRITHDKMQAVMHEFKHHELKSGPGGKAGKVKNPKQAIAIGLSEARRSGAKIPPNPKTGK